MGSSLSDMVGEAVGGVLDMPNGRIHPGLDTAYRATSARLKPLSLGAGLWVSGEIASIEVKTNTIRAVGVLFGGAAPVSCTARGVKLCVCDSAPLGDRGQVSSGTLSTRLRKQLERLEVQVLDVRVEMRLVGHAFCVRIESAMLLPRPRGTDARQLRWQCKHKGFQLQLDGKCVGKASDSEVACSIISEPSSERAELDCQTKVEVQVASDDVLVLLDVAAAIVALAASEADIATATQVADVARSLAVNFANISVRLDAFGEELLQFRCPIGKANITAQDIVLQHTPLRVSSGSGEVSSNLRVRVVGPGGPVVLQHDFPADGAFGFPPWRGAAELLAADPRFSSHKLWLAQLCDGFDVEPGDGGRRTRPRDDESVPFDRAVRPRLS